ncbi:hypothetical protein BJF93_11065 [Xaviernesmea oryzae]|uniref:Uncharacterized protein n=2 Tax=Xaviernesmea oryzae TaxID=464029 RepID=A0A1Q9AW06_9HYPH|nr:hypothetical protein BJF93_11065 [Xaviernesmea oryzae]
MLNMAVGAAGGTVVGRIAGTAAKGTLNNKDVQKDAATADKRAQMGLNTDGKDFAAQYSANGDTYAVSGVKSVQGKTVEISEFSVQKVGEDTSVNVAATSQIRSQMAQQFATEGFDRLTITATRVSGANPDRLMSMTMDLSRYK